MIFHEFGSYANHWASLVLCWFLSSFALQCVSAYSMATIEQDLSNITYWCTTGWMDLIGSYANHWASLVLCWIFIRFCFTVCLHRTVWSQYSKPYHLYNLLVHLWTTGRAYLIGLYANHWASLVLWCFSYSFPLQCVHSV